MVQRDNGKIHYRDLLGKTNLSENEFSALHYMEGDN